LALVAIIHFITRIPVSILLLFSNLRSILEAGLPKPVDYQYDCLSSVAFPHPSGHLLIETPAPRMKNIGWYLFSGG
jgi:hypothetical protein